MKKLLSLLLVILLIFIPLSVPVSAEGDIYYENNTDISPIRNWINDLLEPLRDISSKVSDMGSKISDTFITWIQSLQNHLRNLTEEIKLKFDNLRTSISNGITTLGNHIVTLKNTFIDNLSVLKNSIVNKVTDSINNIKELNTKLLNWFDSKFTHLFVPTFSFSDKVASWKDTFESKFSVLLQIKDMFSNMFNFSETTSAPKFEFTYQGTTVGLIDFSAYAPYRSFVQTLISFFMWFVFLKKLYKSLPGMIMAATGTETQAGRLDYEYDIWQSDYDSGRTDDYYWRLR